MSDDSEDVLRGHNLARRSDHVGKQRLACDFVQHLGPLRFQARALAGGENDNREWGYVQVCWHWTLCVRLVRFFVSRGARYDGSELPVSVHAGLTRPATHAHPS